MADSEPSPDPTVDDDVAASRFTLRVGGEIVSIADYRIDGDVVTITHVETRPMSRGNGFAAALMDGVVRSIRSNGQTIRPLCSYAAAYVRERPALHSLAAV